MGQQESGAKQQTGCGEYAAEGARARVRLVALLPGYRPDGKEPQRGARKERMAHRSRALDRLRGAALLNMIVYHGCYDMVYMFGHSWEWFGTPAAWLWQQVGCWIFIVLSGYCWSLGRRHFRRGAIVLLAGALISVITAVCMPEEAVRFGILTMLGSCTLLMLLIAPLAERIAPETGLLGSAILFLATRNVSQGYFGIGLGGPTGSIPLLSLPQSWYRGALGAWLGFPPPEFASSDYFPLLPWGFLFLAGYYLYGVLKKRRPKGGGSKASTEMGTAWPERMLCFLGRYSLVVYLLHQPLLYGILYLWTMASERAMYY